MIRFAKACVVAFILISNYSFAENRVVVIPLEADSHEKGLEFTCQALGFLPPSSSATYSGIGLRIASINVNCPLNIPVGATITKLTAYYRDQSDSFNAACTLERGNLTNSVASVQLGLTNSTQGKSTDIQVLVDDTITQPEILAGHVYYLACSMSPGIEIRGATVTYDA